jgi:hypothetical protein
MRSILLLLFVCVVPCVGRATKPQLYSEWLKTEKICEKVGIEALCQTDVKQTLDQVGKSDWNDNRGGICLAVKSGQSLIGELSDDRVDVFCSGEAVADSIEKMLQKFIGMGCNRLGNKGDRDRCNAKAKNYFIAKGLTEAARCKGLGICTTGVAQQAAASTTASVTSSAASGGATKILVNQAASAARTSAIETAKAAGKNPAAIAQAGRRAAEAAAKNAARQAGVQVTKVTAKGGVELAKAGTKEATKEAAKGAVQGGVSMASAVAPMVGGLIEGGMAYYEEGELNGKVAAKAGGGAVATVAGAATGALCGPFAWACVPAATIGYSFLFSSIIDVATDETDNVEAALEKFNNDGIPKKVHEDAIASATRDSRDRKHSILLRDALTGKLTTH